MQIEQLLRSQTIQRLDAELLLSFVLQQSKTWLLANNTSEVSTADIDTFSQLAKRRERKEPIAYIIKQKEFYGRNFYVDKNVLIPRPCTEHLIQSTIDYLSHPFSSAVEIDTDVVCWTSAINQDIQPEYIVDVGTGSGCIAITLAKEFATDYKIIATDISSDALEVAKRNSASLDADIEYRQGSLLEPVENLTKPFLVVSNPPYIPTTETLMTDVVEFEPSLALFSGKDGSDAVTELVSQCTENQYCVGFIIECKNTHIDT